ncbi:MAG: DUF3800 domain-containing protein [Victivallaceae bacterium]|nr:DUF3800 domain-containing protein [Victivallaceae bacterium]
MSEYNIYCDESCHLENDGEKVMVLGAVICPKKHIENVTSEIKEIKVKHGLPSYFEIKWTKVSPAKVDFFLALVDYFFSKRSLTFRGLVIPDKSVLKHSEYRQSHDEWYYKMYFDMLKVVIGPNNEYNIYIDIKDTCGTWKIKKLHEVLCNDKYDYNKEIIKKIQQIHSNESQLLQLADLLIGALKTANNDTCKSEAKKQIIEKIKERSGYELTKNTLYRENKTNILIWHGRESGGYNV